MRTREQFIDRWKHELQGIILEGFCTKQTDSGMLFRQMCVAARKLESHLAQMWHEDVDQKPPEPKPANGQPAQPARKAAP